MSQKSGPQKIDWSGIRAAAVAIGIRPAARAAAANLPEWQQKRFEARVMRRASREKWLSTHREVLQFAAGETSAPDGQQGNVIQPAHAKPLSDSVRTGQEIMQSVLSEDDSKTRLAFSKTVRAGAEYAANMRGVSVIKNAHEIQALAKTGALVHGWKGEGASETHIDIRVLAIGGEIG